MITPNYPEGDDLVSPLLLNCEIKCRYSLSCDLQHDLPTLLVAWLDHQHVCCGFGRISRIWNPYRNVGLVFTNSVVSNSCDDMSKSLIFPRARFGNPDRPDHTGSSCLRPRGTVCYVEAQRSNRKPAAKNARIFLQPGGSFYIPTHFCEAGERL